MEEEKFDEEVINPPPEVEAEVVEEVKQLPAEIKEPTDKLSPKKRLIANLSARGYSVDYISTVVSMTKNAVYRILETSKTVQQEIVRIQSGIFSEGDRKMAAEYNKIVGIIDQHLSHPETQEKGIKEWKDLIELRFKLGSGKSGEDVKPLIYQFFGKGDPTDKTTAPDEGSIDAIIIRKRKERGLDIPKITKPPLPDNLDGEEDY